MGGEMYGMGFSPLGGSPIAQYRNASKAFSVPQQLGGGACPASLHRPRRARQQDGGLRQQARRIWQAPDYARQPGEWEPSGIGGGGVRTSAKPDGA